MSLAELFIIAVGLSMDAFAVAICLGLSTKQLTVKKALTIGLYFGIFQALMPLAGYLVGSLFAEKIKAFDHWIAFVLLAFIGGKMIKESYEAQDDACAPETALTPKNMLPLAVATSIDALAVGVSFAFLDVQIGPAVLFIGLVTLLLCMLGAKIGHMFGTRFQKNAEFAGGVILVLMGLKIVLEHTGVLIF